MTVCKNCHNQVKGKFCSNCGQSIETHELNFHFLWHDIQHGLLHLDKGIWFTIRELFTRPGNSIREYVEGKRVKHFKPISFVIILAGILGLLFHYFHVNMLATIFSINGDGEKAVKLNHILEEVSEWVSGHYAVVTLVQLPTYAIGTFLAFRRDGYNYVEHLVLNAFITGQKLIVNILFFPLYYRLNDTAPLKSLSETVNVICIALGVWTLSQFFNNETRWMAFFRALLSYVIFFVIFIALMAAAAFVVYVNVE